jgi:hypothetical protein
MPTVVGLFDTLAHAEDAALGLVQAGFERFEISLLTLQTTDSPMPPGEQSSPIADKSVAGSAAVAGGAVGILVGVGMLMIPGLGPVLGAGPLLATLASGAAGAASGGVASALAGQGIPEDEAESYSEGLRRGGTLVAVRCHMLAMGMAASVMRRFGAVDVSCRVTEKEDGVVGKWGRKDVQPYGEMLQKGEEGRRAEKSEERNPKADDRSQKSEDRSQKLP